MNIKGIIGRKVAMHQLFTATGKIVPVTYISIVPNVVSQTKTVAIDGYDALQLTVPGTKKKTTAKPQQGHLAKINLEATLHMSEIRNMQKFKTGDKVDLSLFSPGEMVNISGLSKGKGTSGVIKRHHFGRGPMSHGSKHHRAPGSIGLSRPDKVWKGQPLPGRKGHTQVTIQNLEIMQVLQEQNLLVIKGSVPGAHKNWLVITNTIKKRAARPPIEWFKANPSQPDPKPSLAFSANKLETSSPLSQTSDLSSSSSSMSSDSAKLEKRTEGKK